MRIKDELCLEDPTRGTRRMSGALRNPGFKASSYKVGICCVTCIAGHDIAIRPYRLVMNDRVFVYVQYCTFADSLHAHIRMADRR